MEYIDHLLESYEASDEVVTSRLPRLFKGMALDWFIRKKKSVGKTSWGEWKKLIHIQFGTDVWEDKMLAAYETDLFDPTKHLPYKWCLTQKKRIDCIYDRPSQKFFTKKILKKCPGNLEHDVMC